MDKVQFDSLFNSIEIIQNPNEFWELIQWFNKNRPVIDGIIEIGILNGGTMLFWQELLSSDGIYAGIDIEKKAVDNAKARFGSDIRMNFIQGDSSSYNISEECGKILGGKKIDVLFIDGNHSAAFIRADYLNYKDYLKPNGLIVFHDIHHPEYPEIGRFFNKLSALPEYSGIKFIDKDKPFGIGILIKK